MFTPDGQLADKMDKIMLLAQWTRTLIAERGGVAGAFLEENPQPFISAGMGRPTFPINARTISSNITYWSNKLRARLKAAVHPSDKSDESSVIGYGDPRGDLGPREIMARAMSRWYGTAIDANHILFTSGGAGALRVIFETFNSLYKNTPNYRVITPFPHYPLYADNQHQLHPIDVMHSPGYRLTAQCLEKSIMDAYKQAGLDNGHPKAVLLCNPNSPLGTVFSEDELREVAIVLRRYPSLHIVLDEAYAEMCFSGKNAHSLVTIAPDLKPRLIILRSATKALSAAGERMGMLMAFDPSLMAMLLNKNIGMIGHASRSGQMAYAETMLDFTEEEHSSLAQFYQSKVAYVHDRLKRMGAAMPDPLYTVEGTFYILADFSDLLGLELPADAQRALGKTGLVQTSEELAYYLLFQDAIMLAPGSYFGLPSDNGFLRITCSAAPDELAALMDRLESRLVVARQQKKLQLLQQINDHLGQLSHDVLEPHADLIAKIAAFEKSEDRASELKEQNNVLNEIRSMLFVHLQRTNVDRITHTVIRIQSSFRRHVASKSVTVEREEQDHDWKSFLDVLIPTKVSRAKGVLSGLSVEERLEIAPWLDYLSQKETPQMIEPVGSNKRG